MNCSYSENRHRKTALLCTAVHRIRVFLHRISRVWTKRRQPGAADRLVFRYREREPDMRKGSIILLTIAVILLTAGCGRSSVSAAQQTEYGMKAADFGSYNVPAGWVKAERYSTEDKIFYVQEGEEEDEQPDNISIEFGRNKYKLEEHMKFRDAIVKQLAMQLSGRQDTMVSGEGVYTDQEYIMYVFTIEEEESGIMTKQYYIVDDYRYCLIILTNFDGSGEAVRAAGEMADSFVWTTAAGQE